VLNEALRGEFLIPPVETAVPHNPSPIIDSNSGRPTVDVMTRLDMVYVV